MIGRAAIDSARKRTSRLCAAAIAMPALAATIAVASSPDSAGAQAPQAPANIVVLMTDDQEPASLGVMSIVREQMQRRGVTMKGYFNNFPLCCPSRATLLTGQYAHNHGVLSNQPPEGGFGVFDERYNGNTVADWLQDAGYATGYIGKYLNGYAEPDEYGNLPTYVPSGWNDWRVLAPSNAQYFDYTLNQNGTLANRFARKRDYSTDVFTTKAKRFIRLNAPNPNPFFLMLGYAAPHGGGGGSPGRSCNRGARPAPRHLRTLKKLQKEERFDFPPSFNEAKIFDKPTSVQQMPPLTSGQIRDIKRKRRCAWESLLAVDESVGEILAELKRVGEGGTTYVFFLSDNGYLRGEHRIRNQKRYLYDESTRVPFVVRGPGVARGEKSADIATNADLVPTILEISGASAGVAQDGQSLLPTFASPKTENGRTILLEAYAGQEIIGLRNSRYLYAEWDTELPLPEKELYDTYVDPYQLNNLANEPTQAPLVAELGRQLDDLIDCGGADCRGGPSVQLSFTSGGAGPKGCAFEPVVARLTSPREDEIVSAAFRAGGKRVPEDTVAPFEAVLPYGAMRRQLPEPADVVAKALFEDGRRVAVPAKLRACARSRK